MAALELFPGVELVRGQRLGRYLVLDQLGAGGMGVVLSAYDPELDRRIAIKVLRPDAIAEGSKGMEHTVRLGGDGEPRHLVRERLLAEGRAMARLSHPNLVAVYEVGEVGELVFLAMEQVEGVRLTVWLNAAERSWRDVVAAFAQAGRALAAAHAARLVHGDFKPDNVLVERSGRVRVLDFGLARAAGSEAEGTSLVGTPRYMAPEQFALEPVDARCDQFAFCVALYEALYGAHPFPGDSDAEIAASVSAGRARPPTHRRGPRWLERAIMTGLARDPGSRFRSIEELLVLLERRPHATRRRLGAALAGVMGVSLVAVGFAVGHETEEDRCTGGRAQLAAVWDRAVAGRMQGAFASTHRPHAPSSAERVAQRLDLYGGEWMDMHRAACQATVRGEQSPDLLDRRMTCLGRRLGQVGALVELFVRRADGAVVDKALDLVAELEPLAGCADTAALLELAPPPADPSIRARLRELENQLARADLERDAGRPQPAIDGALPVIEAARGLDQPLLGAKAARVRGRALADLGRPVEGRDELLRALGLAQRAGDNRLVATLLIDLLNVIGEYEKRSAEAQLVGRLAEAALERTSLRTDPDLRARLLLALGDLAEDDGRIDRAIELNSQALAIRRRTRAPDDPAIAAAENSLSNALVAKKRFEEARVHLRQALAIWRKAYGEHPRIAMAESNLGVAYMEESRPAEAREHLLVSLAEFERQGEDLHAATVLNNLGNLESDAGDYTAALKYKKAALATYERKLDANHPYVATALHNLATTFRAMGEVKRALALDRRAFAICEKRLDEGHPLYALSLASNGEDLRRLGRPAVSLEYQRRAQALVRSRLGDDSRHLATLFSQEAYALIDLGRRREAVPLLERALQLMPLTENERPRAAFALARAIDPRGPRSTRTRLLALQALTAFAAMRDGRRDLDEVSAYLRGRVKR